MSLLTVSDGILLGQIQNNIIVGMGSQSLSNVTREQCICTIIRSNGSFCALNYFSTNQTCQLFASNLDPMTIQFNMNSLLIFINRSSLAIVSRKWIHDELERMT